MKKAILGEPATKAKRREIKKRPRMRVHGKSLLKSSPHAGKKLSQQ